MNSKRFSALLLALGMTGFVMAQEKTPTPPAKKLKKEEEIIIRKKTDKDEKMTIVVDGDKVTVNGKDIADLKDDEIQVLRGRGRMAMLSPRIADKIKMEKLAPIFNENFNFSFSANSAVLGVGTEKNEKGAKITEVTKESAASKAGLQKEDIITKVGDTKVATPEELYNAIGKYKPEDKVSISYLRDGKEGTATAVLEKSQHPVMVRGFGLNDDMRRNYNFEMPNMPEIKNLMIMRRPRLGLQVQDMDNANGVKVLDVNEDSPAAKAGLQKDDQILSVDGKEVKSVDALREKTKDLKEGETVKLSYQRNGKTQTAELVLPRKLKTANL